MVISGIHFMDKHKDITASLGRNALNTILKVFLGVSKGIFCNDSKVLSCESIKNTRHPERSEGSVKSKDSSVVSLPLNDGRRYAFTLAEVLITIGIIGVVAAITIPTLITNYQKKVTVNRLKQTYSIIEQAVKRSEAENGDISSWDFNMPSDERFEKYLAPYLHIIQRSSSESLLSDKKIYNAIFN